MAIEKINVDAMRVPNQVSSEAAKDYEQKLMRVCAWLDARGHEVSFNVTTSKNKVESFIEFRDLEQEETYEVYPGHWIVFLSAYAVVILSDEEWEELEKLG